MVTLRARAKTIQLVVGRPDSFWSGALIGFHFLKRISNLSVLIGRRVRDVRDQPEKSWLSLAEVERIEYLC